MYASYFTYNNILEQIYDYIFENPDVSNVPILGTCSKSIENLFSLKNKIAVYYLDNT